MPDAPAAKRPKVNGLPPGHRNRDVRGWRAKVGVIAPSTNTIVQPDYDDIRVRIPGGGVTFHYGRITVPNMDWTGKDGRDPNEAFMAFVEAVMPQVNDAADRTMSAECDWMCMGMSAPQFFHGYAACVAKREEMARRCGVPVSSGSFSCEAALKAFGAKRIAWFSPYAPAADKQVTRFFTEAGFVVVRGRGMAAANPIAIAEITAEQIKATAREMDSDDVDALVQIGTNLSGATLIPELERIHNKPVIAINTATVWHCLRGLGITDKIAGFGRLLEEH